MFNGTGYRSAAAHRWAYLRYVGPLAAGEVIRFTCENRSCQNRDHWVVESRPANVRRTRTGARNGRAKLTPVAVSAIRASGEPTTDLATRYGVGATTIKDARSENTWR